MAIITLTTDFGQKDHFVGAVKGAIFSEIENYLKRFSPNDLDVILNVTKALNEKY